MILLLYKSMILLSCLFITSLTQHKNMILSWCINFWISFFWPHQQKKPLFKCYCQCNSRVFWNQENLLIWIFEYRLKKVDLDWYYSDSSFILYLNKFGTICEKSSHFGSVSFEDSIQNFIIKGCLESDLF
jgi:hypothetical protein